MIIDSKNKMILKRKLFGYPFEGNKMVANDILLECNESKPSTKTDDNWLSVSFHESQNTPSGRRSHYRSS